MRQSLVSRIERLEQRDSTDNRLVITIKNFDGGELVGFSGSAGIVKRAADEADDDLRKRAASLMSPASWGGIVMREVRA